jgi:NADH dehydrogenase
VFVVGDAAASQMEQPVSGAAANASPQYVPGLAAAAIQMGTHAGQMIAATIAGSPRTPFRYRNKGTLAVIGRGRAIADFGRVRLTGWLAFYAWFFLHLMFLAGFRNRVAVFLEWVYAYATYRPGARLINDDDRAAVRGREASQVDGRR